MFDLIKLTCKRKQSLKLTPPYKPDLLHWTSTAHKLWKNFKVSNTGTLQFCCQFRFHITFIYISVLFMFTSRPIYLLACEQNSVLVLYSTYIPPNNWSQQYMTLPKHGIRVTSKFYTYSFFPNFVIRRYKFFHNRSLRPIWNVPGKWLIFWNSFRVLKHNDFMCFPHVPHQSFDSEKETRFILVQQKHTCIAVFQFHTVLIY